jgi:hypothetical protein
VVALTDALLADLSKIFRTEGRSYRLPDFRGGGAAGLHRDRLLAEATRR